MKFSKQEIKANRDYFAAKIAAEKQKFVVGKWAEGNESSPDFLLLDVRDRGSFAEGHIKGALSAPMAELKTLMPGLPKDKELVTYCSHHF
jgi:rhodanese-related sulfurtransferase